MKFDKRSTEVYKYLISLQTYAYGDLELFHFLCAEAEKRETPTGTNSSTTTATTTSMSEGSMYAPPKTSREFRATIPFAMMLLSCIEILGYLTKSDGDKRQTLENIKYFLKKIPLTIIKDDDIDFLVLIFRHGLAHAYFPKLNYALSYHSSNPDTLFYKTSSSPNEILNVKHLEFCFNVGLESIINGSASYPNMEIQYKKLIDSYRKKHASIINAR